MTTEKVIEILSKTRYDGQIAGERNVVEVCERSIAALREQEQRRWIPVTERLPSYGEDVLIYSKIEGVCLSYYDGDSFGHYYVTHWMPLPEPPKGE